MSCGTSVESVLLVSEGLCSRGLGGGREKEETKEDYERGMSRGRRTLGWTTHSEGIVYVVVGVCHFVRDDIRFR